jgi:hypothetical protein
LGLPRGCVIRYTHIPTHPTDEPASGLGAERVKDADPCPHLDSLDSVRASMPKRCASSASRVRSGAWGATQSQTERAGHLAVRCGGRLLVRSEA